MDLLIHVAAGVFVVIAALSVLELARTGQLQPPGTLWPGDEDEACRLVLQKDRELQERARLYVAARAGEQS